MLPRVGTSPGGVIRGKSISAFILTTFGAIWFWLAVVNSGRSAVFQLNEGFRIARSAGQPGSSTPRANADRPRR